MSIKIKEPQFQYVIPQSKPGSLERMQAKWSPWGANMRTEPCINIPGGILWGENKILVQMIKIEILI